MKICFSWLIVMLCLSVLLCACRQQQALFKTGGLPMQTSVQNSATELYRIKPGDLLEIRNLQNIAYIADVQQISGIGNTQIPSYLVEEDGTVALPVIGRVAVSGLSRMNASRKIEGLYQLNLLKNPIIELKIINLKVTILGEVRVQGNYLLAKDKTTLVEMIGEAGGLSEKANEKNIKIIRGDKANPQIIIADLSNVGNLANPALDLQNNDIIYVSQNKRAVRSDSMQNLSSIFQSALVFLNTALIIYSISKK